MYRIAQYLYICFTDNIGYIPFVVATILFPFHEYHLPNYKRFCNNMSNTTGATWEAGTANPSGATEIIHLFCVCLFRF